MGSVEVVASKKGKNLRSLRKSRLGSVDELGGFFQIESAALLHAFDTYVVYQKFLDAQEL
jgi:hypothetical protein